MWVTEKMIKISRAYSYKNLVQIVHIVQACSNFNGYSR